MRETSSRPSPVAYFLAAGTFLLSFSQSPLSTNVAAFTVCPSAYRRASGLILSAKKDFVISKGLADWASSDQPDEAAADPSGSGFDRVDRRARRQMEKEDKRRRKKAGLGSGSDGPGDPGALDAVDCLLGALGRDPLPRTSAAAYAAFSEDKEDEKK